MSGKIVTCNFSRRTAAMPDFAEKVIEIANTNGVSSSAVAIELVEYDIADDTEQVIKNLDILHEKGFRILLDDWGAGYTSYSDICNLPIDILKMDRSILNNACTEKGRIVFENIVQLGNMLKIPVLCEGIETEEQAYIAGHYGCKISQGFYHYLPAPPEKYNSLME